jgi:hypothetical protein
MIFLYKLIIDENQVQEENKVITYRPQLKNKLFNQS